MAVRLERQDMVATIVIDRPEARNAVDGDAARALVAAFREFEGDDGLRVAVLWGAGGTFCAGADLKTRGTGRGLRLAPDGDGPMGPTRMAFTKPVIAAVEGYAVAGGRRDGDLRRLLPAMGRAAARRRDRTAPAPDRALASSRHDPDGTARRGPRGSRLRTRQPRGARGPGARRGGGSGADHRGLPPALRAERSTLGMGRRRPVSSRRARPRVRSRQSHPRFGGEPGGGAALRRGRGPARPVLITSGLSPGAG